MIQSVTFELKPCVMIVTPPAVTKPVEHSATASAPKKQRNCLLNADASLTAELPELFEKERARTTIAKASNRTAKGNRAKCELARNGDDAALYGQKIVWVSFAINPQTMTRKKIRTKRLPFRIAT